MAISTQYGDSPERFGHKDYYAAKQQGLSDLQILGWMNQNIDKIAGNNLPGGGGLYDEVAGGIRQEQDDRITGLTEQINRQQADYTRRLDQLQEQTRRQQEVYQQQIQQYQNQANAYVPPSEASAQDDNKDAMQTPATGTKRLSSLAIIEGLGTNANPLSGLQLA